MAGIDPKRSSPSWPRYSSHRLAKRQRASARSIFRVFVGDVGLDGSGGGDVGVGAGLIAFLPLGKAAPIESARQPGIDLQRRVVIGDGLVEAVEPQIDEASAVETVGVVRGQSDAGVAIREGERRIAFAGGAQPAAVDIGEGAFRIDLDRARVVGDSAIEIALGFIGAAAVAVGGGIFRIDLDRLREVGDGSVEFTLGHIRVAAVVEAFGVFCLELDRLRVVGDGAVEIALGFIGVAAVVEAFGVFRINLDRPRVVGDGAVGVALGCVGVAAIAIGGGGFRIDLDRARAVGDGAVEIALSAVGGTAVVIGGGVFRIDLDRARAVGDGAVEIAL